MIARRAHPGSRARLLGEGALVFAATSVSNALVFLGFVIASRALGPDEYGTVAAMFGVVIILTIPSLALQTLVAREAASALASGDGEASVAAVHHRRARQALVVGGGITLVGVAGAPALAPVLGLASAWPLVWTAAAALPILLMAEGRGLQQGRQQFGALGVNLVSEGAVRILATVIVLLGGFGATGVTAAPALGAGAAAVLALAGARALPAASRVAPTVARAGVSLVLFAGFAGVTNLDVVIAHGVLQDVQTGEYGAAALFGRVVLLAPLAVGLVVVPKAISIATSGRSTLPLLAMAVGAVLATSGVLAAIGLVAPDLVRFATVGGEFAGADEVIRLYGVAMLGFATLLVVGLHNVALSRTVTAWACLAAVAPQALALVLVPDRGVALVVVMLVTSAILVAIGIAEAVVASRAAGPGDVARPTPLSV